jgi:hypothetical protein
MKFKSEYIFDGPIDMVWEAREKRFQNPERFPELQKHQEIERREEGKKIFSKRLIELTANIPKPLQRILSPEMLKCVDESEYDMDTNVHKWTVRPNFKAKVFTCIGYSKYDEFEEGGSKKTKRHLELEVKVDIPLLGNMAESVVLEAYKKSLEKDNRTIAKMIEIMKNEKV